MDVTLDEEGRLADFAGEADAQDAGTLSRYDPVKQVALRSVTNCPKANQTPCERRPHP